MRLLFPPGRRAAPSPPRQVFDAASRSPHAYSAACQGADFWLHHHLSELDLAVASLNPDAWLACDPACKLAWARGWLRAHLREALRLQKPLLLVGVGSLRPHASRAALLRLVREEVADALGHRHPMAGATACAHVHARARVLGRPCMRASGQLSAASVCMLLLGIAPMLAATHR